MESVGYSWSNMELQSVASFVKEHGTLMLPNCFYQDNLSPLRTLQFETLDAVATKAAILSMAVMERNIIFREQEQG